MNLQTVAHAGESGMFNSCLSGCQAGSQLNKCHSATYLHHPQCLAPLVQGPDHMTTQTVVVLTAHTKEDQTQGCWQSAHTMSAHMVKCKQCHSSRVWHVCKLPAAAHKTWAKAQPADWVLHSSCPKGHGCAVQTLPSSLSSQGPQGTTKAGNHTASAPTCAPPPALQC